MLLAPDTEWLHEILFPQIVDELPVVKPNGLKISDISE
jgi:hypothetical protein